MSAKRWVYDNLSRPQKLKLVRHVKLFIVDMQQNVFTESEEEKEEMGVVKTFFDQLHEDMVCRHIEEHLLPHKRKIHAKDMSYFLTEKGSIFAGLPEKRVAYYSSEFTNPRRLSKDDRDTIWHYLIVMIGLLEGRG